MAFFSSDLNLAEEIANPKVTQATQVPSPGVSALSATQPVSGDALSQLASAISGGYSTGAGWGTQQDGLTSLTGTGALSTDPLTGFFPGTDTGITTVPSLTPVDDTIGMLAGGDGDSADGFDFSGLPQNLQEYLQAKETTDPWATRIAASLIPGFGMMSTLTDVGYGINPFADTWLGDLFGAQPTFDWYEGSTDYFGQPVSDVGLTGMFDGYGSDWEQDVAETFGWGSEEHFAAIEESFGWGDDYGMPTTVEDVAVDTSGTITPIDVSGTYMDDWTGDDAFSEGGTYSDWGSAEEFADDFGMDDFGDDWGDWGEDDGGWGW